MESISFAKETRVELGGEGCSHRQIVESPFGGLVTSRKDGAHDLPVAYVELVTVTITEPPVMICSKDGSSKELLRGPVSMTAGESTTYVEPGRCDCENMQSCPNEAAIDEARDNLKQALTNLTNRGTNGR